MSSATDRVIREKVQRLRSGMRPRVLDLFSGCGGLSLGFSAAGFTILAGLESDATAVASYGANFHEKDPRHSAPRDITLVKPYELVLDLKLGRVSDSFDVIIGGPPCQAFARVGRSKLRQVDSHPEAFQHDPRARLYALYLDYVKKCRPLAILMENVPDIMNFGGHNIPEEICGVLKDEGYVCAYTLLNSAFYGVPQMRERMFLIAYHREIAKSVTFPAPKNWINLPPGYEGSRRVALKLLQCKKTYGAASNYIDPPEATNALPPAVTAEEAIGDLPEIDARKLLRKGILKRGARRFDQPIPYDNRRPVSDYAKAMKTWPGFEAREEISDHVIRYLPRDYPLFARMCEGDQYPEAHRHALKMFEENLSRLAKKGFCLAPTSDEYIALKKSIVPPYDAGKFPNKWRKISHNQPVRTIMAHLKKDGYSHIHYDNRQARTISVREAARLQSFPDGFVFAGAMNQAFQQIGNAVPPLMAMVIAQEMMNHIRVGLKTSAIDRCGMRHRETSLVFENTTRLMEAEVEA